MNSMSVSTQAVEPQSHRFMHAAVLFLSVVVIGTAAIKFRSSIHLWFSGAFILTSVAALTVSAIDSLTGSRAYHTRLVITALILSLTVAFVLLGAR